MSGRVGPGHGAAFCVHAARRLDHLLLNQAPPYSVMPLPVAQSRLWKMMMCTMYMPRAGARQTLSQNPALRMESWAIFQVNIPNFPQLQIELKILIPVF